MLTKTIVSYIRCCVQNMGNWISTKVQNDAKGSMWWNDLGIMYDFGQ